MSVTRERKARFLLALKGGVSARRNDEVEKNTDTKRVNINVPTDAWQWVQERARYHSATISAVVVMSLRAAMEAEADTKARKTAATSAE